MMENDTGSPPFASVSCMGSPQHTYYSSSRGGRAGTGGVGIRGRKRGRRGRKRKSRRGREKG